MAFCGNCGTQTADGTTFCPTCGTSIGGGGVPGTQPQTSPPQQSYQQQTPPPQQGYQQQPYQGYQQQGYGAQTDNTKLYAILSYFWILWIIPLATGEYKKSEYLKLHTNQGINLAIFSFGGGIIAGIIKELLYWAPSIGNLLGAAVTIASIVFVILGALSASKMETTRLPILGLFDILK